ncbi:MAG: OmpA family protein [Syntrophomonadaceae bacterium]|nr:OmpA family protein [Syntrophomonadaceae bacterium]
MERWLLTYADMITLLMVFFIMMYTISTVNADKFRALAENLGMVLTGSPPAGIIEEGTNSTVPELTGEAKHLADLQQALNEFIAREELGEQITVNLEERGLVVRFQTTVLFARGSADLTPEARRIIDRVGDRLNDLPNYIRVEGHTCDLPINTPQYPSNWELSTARATNVLQELISSCNISPERLSAIGYGEYRPRVPNINESSRQMNRRIDIVILRTKYDEVEPNNENPDA